MRKFFAFFSASIALIMGFSACDDTISTIGSSLIKDEVIITVDSARHKLEATTVYDQSFDARAQSMLLGSIKALQYGELDCSFVAQLMPATKLTMPDSLGIDRVDSLKLILRTQRGDLTGDSLTPQQLKVFALNKQIPSSITSSFDISGYYDPAKPLAEITYTLSKLANTDSTFFKGVTLGIAADLPVEWGKRIVEAYRTNPEPFQWPTSFAQKFPGILVKPSFGSGCIGNFRNVAFMIYYYTLKNVAVTENGESKLKQVHQRDSMAVFSTAPEVISSNLLKYSPADMLEQLIASGQHPVTTPGGYVTKITFPLKEILDKYYSKDFNLSVVGNLTFELPATPIAATKQLDVPPYLLMVKTSELNEFFSGNKIPDNINSFWARYDSAKGCYRFSSMRNYLLEAIKNKGEVDNKDVEFTLVPVNMTVETYTEPYTGVSVTKLLACTPYMGAPTVALLNTDNALICLTFTNQVIE